MDDSNPGLSFPKPESTTAGMMVVTPEIQPVAVGDQGATVRPLLETPRVRASLLVLPTGAVVIDTDTSYDRIMVLVDGAAVLKGADAQHDVQRSTLVYAPAGVTVAEKLESTSVDTSFLHLQVLADDGCDLIRNYGTWVDDLLIVQPEDTPDYQPDNHDKTVNNCIFINGTIEVIRGQLGAGGGSGRHKHDGFEQLTYLMKPKPDVLLYSPPGVEHGGGTEADLDLLVVYSPPYGESLKYE